MDAGLDERYVHSGIYSFSEPVKSAFKGHRQPYLAAPSLEIVTGIPASDAELEIATGIPSSDTGLETFTGIPISSSGLSTTGASLRPNLRPVFFWIFIFSTCLAQRALLFICRKK